MYYPAKQFGICHFFTNVQIITRTSKYNSRP